jgi:hypothetical protein
MKVLLFLIFLSPFLVFAEGPVNKPEVDQNIKKFFKNPVEFYYSNINSLPVEAGTTNERKYQDRIKRKIISNSPRRHTKSSPAVNDDAQDLYPLHQLVTKITELKNEAHIPIKPWSDDYWPINKGVLGARYMDEEFHDIYDWKEAKNYVMEFKVHSNMIPSFINNLSPAEKFDLIIAPETQLPLNFVMWSQGKSYYDRYGEVENWMGICHGWAPASFMVERPKNAITVKSYNGNFDITFYPSDIKALASLLWASTEYDTLFVGGRCRSKDPETDENDRAIARDCLDNNPATLHLALTNGIGIHQQSFVMDATPDYEVWNQPVISYNYSYFNVINEETVTDLNKAIIPIEEFSKDPFKKHRSKKAKYVVGIHLEVIYGVETTPSHRTEDNEYYDQTSSIFYYYDLELDKNKNIIGGEWYNEQHPDFLWRPSDNTEALTYFDYYLLSEKPWDGKSALPQRIKDLAVSAAKKGQPLAYLVKSLVKLSQSQEGE